MSLQVEQDPTVAAVDKLYQNYRALSPLAVCSGALGLLSIVAMLDWTLAIIPFMGMLSGVLALVRIRRNPTEYTGERFALIGVTLSMLFLVTGWAWLSYSYATEVPPGYERISYDMLAPDDTPEATIPPEAAAKLDGKKVFIKGYVYQPSGGYTTGIRQFVLVRDRGDCCFGGNPKITDMIQVKLTGGLAATFDMRVRRLAGLFRVEPGQASDGLGGVIYHLDADYLK